MLDAVQNFIPLITSESGLCLSAQNWQDAKIDAAAYSLETLLHKPGLPLLKKISNLADYLGWQGTLILNATSLITNREGVCAVRSPFDGSMVKITAAELVALIHHLKPDAVILPKNILQEYPQIWTNWSNKIAPFVHADDLHYQQVAHPHGVYFNYTDDSVLRLLDKWAHLPRYVMGTLGSELMQQVRAKGIRLIETDEPAKAACAGRVYSQDGEVDLADASVQMVFEPIDAQCTCPVCAQKYTKAYFHHLLQHTPLLCQRFLIQHNAFWMSAKM